MCNQVRGVAAIQHFLLGSMDAAFSDMAQRELDAALQAVSGAFGKR